MAPPEAASLAMLRSAVDKALHGLTARERRLVQLRYGLIDGRERTMDAELERLLALGASPADVGQTGTENWHVLADPEGNVFCLLHTRLQPL